jgi:hypothetical protein
LGVAERARSRCDENDAVFGVDERRGRGYIRPVDDAGRGLARSTELSVLYAGPVAGVFGVSPKLKLD